VFRGESGVSLWHMLLNYVEFELPGDKGSASVCSIFITSLDYLQ